MLQEFLIAIDSDQSCYPPETLLITDNTRNAIAFTDCKLYLHFYLRKILLAFKCSRSNLYKRMCVRACVSSNHSGCQSARFKLNTAERIFIDFYMINIHSETNTKSQSSISCNQQQQHDRCKNLCGRVTSGSLSQYSNHSEKQA